MANNSTAAEQPPDWYYGCCGTLFLVVILIALWKIFAKPKREIVYREVEVPVEAPIQQAPGAPVIYNIYQQGPAPPQQPHTRTTTKEIVKIRCPFCKRKYDETLSSCPHCGAGD